MIISTLTKVHKAHSSQTQQPDTNENIKFNKNTGVAKKQDVQLIILNNV